LKKKCSFNISTNGSLITGDWIAWFDRYRFTVELSFDGPAQAKGRQKGSFDSTLAVMNRLGSSPDIRLLVNAVFYPATVEYLADSIRFLLNAGAANISLGLDLHRRWNRQSIEKLEMELVKLRKLLFEHYQKTGTVPLDYFPDLDLKGIWRCSAGLDQVTVTADGEIWGCALFYEHFKGKEGTNLYRSFSLGSVHNHTRDNRELPEAVVENYGSLTQDNFYTKRERCFLCDHIEVCGVCPIVSADHSADLEQVPNFVCTINRISIREKKRLFHDIAVLKKKTNPIRPDSDRVGAGEIPLKQ
jgi:radical SAM protein with 4Fe4S-binding SPASM domain